MRKAVIAAILLLPAVLPAKSPLTSSDGYSQAIQLERGWNLVSWYIWPAGDEYFPPELDDLFYPQGPNWWFQYDRNNPIDKVGKYDADLYNDIFYPGYGYTGDPQGAWEWDLQQAYPIYLESPAHFWEFTERPLYTPTVDNFTPSDAWDESRELGLNNPSQATHWYFISYPLRKQIKIRDSNTIAWLFDDQQNPGNPLFIVKDDAGNWYKPGVPRATLEYLVPGEGYFLGFRSGETVENCPWFTDEGSVPECEPSSPKDDQLNAASSAHFIFKSRTHWSYPIQVDTVVIEGVSPEIGDEIAVFDGDLCVGAAVFDGQYPICLSAWKDDIATPDQLDGYVVNDEMIFKWYDASENQEITFEPPPQTQAAEADPYFPTHSGFGKGFCAVRSLVDGVQSVKQLPQEYRLGQNYPNPFNPTTVFPLELPQRSRVTVDIFDVSGRLVWTIEAGVRNAGRANVHFNASRLASGVYFYRVTAEGLEHGGRYQDVGKMLLLK